MDAKNDFTQTNFILLLVLLAKIMSELFGYYKHLKTRFLFACWLPLLASRLYFRLVMGLTVGVAIDGAKLIGKKVVIGFFK